MLPKSWRNEAWKGEIQLTKNKHRKADTSAEVEIRICLKEKISNGVSLGTLDGGDPWQWPKPLPPFARR